MLRNAFLSMLLVAGLLGGCENDDDDVGDGADPRAESDTNRTMPEIEEERLDLSNQLNEISLLNSPEMAIAFENYRDDIFRLHSRPSSENKLYIDFQGETITGKIWNTINTNLELLEALPFDLDGDAAGYSQEEVLWIATIWHRVAEDFAPFDIDVTTEEPEQFGPQTGHVLVTEGTDAFGSPMPAATQGGYSIIDGFGTETYVYSLPSFVYYKNLGSDLTVTATGVSHEFGHSLGLEHDGIRDGILFNQVYTGHDGPGFTSWGPIMGRAETRDLTQWSQGDYAEANNKEDDVAMIADRLGFANDDHGNTIESASLLSINPRGDVNATNPEIDPFNIRPFNKGIIEKRSDVDLFGFSVDKGAAVQFSITAAWEAFNYTQTRGANLDIAATLYDADNNQLAYGTNPDNTDAFIALEVGPGDYYLSIDGVGTGDPLNGYDDYGSLGQYYIRGEIRRDIPSPVDDAVTVLEDSQITISPLANDLHPDGDSLTLVALDEPDFGLAQIDGNQVLYTPNEDFFGVDSFSYDVQDSRGNAGSGLVVVTVTQVYDGPVGVDDFGETNIGESIVFNVLENDLNVDKDMIYIPAAQNPSHGQIEVVKNQAIKYTPDPGFVGEDSFTYIVQAQKSRFVSNATVRISVVGEDNPPVAVDDSASTQKNTSVEIAVLENDYDPDGGEVYLMTVFEEPTSGTATENEGGTITYTPDEGFVGTDSLKYIVIDETNMSASATVSITVEDTSISYVALDRSDWVLSASHHERAINKAIDGSLSTRWDTKAIQAPNQWIEIDLGTARSFDRIELDSTGSPEDYPRGYAVYISAYYDEYFGGAIATGSGEMVTVIDVPSATARYVKIEQTGSTSWNWWSIHELNLFAIGEDPPDGGEDGVLDRDDWVLSTSHNEDELGNAIDDSAASRWTTVKPQQSDQWIVIDLNAAQTFNRIELDSLDSPKDYPREYALFVSDDGQDWGGLIAMGVGQAVTTIEFPSVTAQYVKISQTGSDSFYWWSIHDLNLYLD